MRGSGEVSQGPTGLEGALPGGDGRAMRAYRAEYRGDVVRRVDSLSLSCQEGWQRDDLASLVAAYDPEAVLLPGEGSFVRGADAVRAYLGLVLPLGEGLITWRDDIVASGEMAVTLGRYQAGAVGGGVLHRGIHFTVSSRRGRDWRIRAQGFLPSQGSVPVLPDRIISPFPDEVTAEVVRRRRGGSAARRAGGSVAQWAVAAYWTTNSAVQSLRYAWSNGDVDALMEFMAPDAFVRLPGGVGVSGAASVRGALVPVLSETGSLGLSMLDHDASERVSFVLGRYVLEDGERDGFYLLVLKLENGGPKIRALLMTDPDRFGTQESAPPIF